MRIPFLNREDALRILAERRAAPPGRIDNAGLVAGSPMYYYCMSCGHVADIKSEDWFLVQPKDYCDYCQLFKDCGWLEE